RDLSSKIRVKLENLNGESNDLLKDNKSAVESEVVIKEEILDVKPLKIGSEIKNLKSNKVLSIENENVKKDAKVMSTTKRKGRKKCKVKHCTIDKRKTRGKLARKSRTTRQKDNRRYNVNRISPKKRGRPKKRKIENSPKYPQFECKFEINEDSKKNLLHCSETER
ncbi:unnamed protein product, partial [Meganyctiphanes norvegica]